MNVQAQMTSLESAEALLKRRAESLAAEVEEERIEEALAVLMFRLGDEWYAVEVDSVREIYQQYDVTPIPCVPDFVLGVVNIRGEVISVTDLVQLMGIGKGSVQPGQPPAVVIEDSVCATAIVVDEIGDIAEVPVSSIEPPLSVIDRRQLEFASGAVEVDGRMIGLLNTGRILTPVGESRASTRGAEGER